MKHADFIRVEPKQSWYTDNGYLDLGQEYLLTRHTPPKNIDYYHVPFNKIGAFTFPHWLLDDFFKKIRE